MVVLFELNLSNVFLLYSWLSSGKKYLPNAALQSFSPMLSFRDFIDLALILWSLFSVG